MMLDGKTTSDPVQFPPMPAAPTVSAPLDPTLLDAVERALADFLAAHPDFVLQPAGAFLPAAARDLVTPAGALRSWPHRHDLDAFFAVRLRRS